MKNTKLSRKLYNGIVQITIVAAAMLSLFAAEKYGEFREIQIVEDTLKEHGEEDD